MHITKDGKDLVRIFRGLKETEKLSIINIMNEIKKKDKQLK